MNVFFSSTLGYFIMSLVEREVINTLYFSWGSFKKRFDCS